MLDKMNYFHECETYDGLDHLQMLTPNRRGRIMQPTTPKTGGCLDKINEFKDVHV